MLRNIRSSTVIEGEEAKEILLASIPSIGMPLGEVGVVEGADLLAIVESAPVARTLRQPSWERFKLRHLQDKFAWVVTTNLYLPESIWTYNLSSHKEGNIALTGLLEWTPYVLSGGREFVYIYVLHRIYTQDLPSVHHLRPESFKTYATNLGYPWRDT